MSVYLLEVESHVWPTFLNISMLAWQSSPTSWHRLRGIPFHAFLVISSSYTCRAILHKQILCAHSFVRSIQPPHIGCLLLNLRWHKVIGFHHKPDLKWASLFSSKIRTWWYSLFGHRRLHPLFKNCGKL